VNPLLIRVDEIEESSQPWEADLSREFLDEALAGPPPTEFKAGDKAHIKADLTKMGREVLVRGKFAVPLEGQCKRCLKPLPLSAPTDFTLTYVPVEPQAAPAKKGAEGEKGEKRRGKQREADEEGTASSFDLAEVDVETYDGHTIDLSRALREQVLLALPPSPLCQEDCKGLCPVCGADRNERDCGHKPESTDPRWQALKKIQLDKKE
jgi:uncharacterized protein